LPLEILVGLMNNIFSATKLSDRPSLGTSCLFLHTKQSILLLIVDNKFNRAQNEQTVGCILKYHLVDSKYMSKIKYKIIMIKILSLLERSNFIFNIEAKL
jgi:hypothetical protein